MKQDQQTGEKDMNDQNKLLAVIIEESKVFSRAIARALEENGFKVVEATSFDAAKEVLDEDMPDIVILSLVRFRTEGLTILDQLREIHPELPVIILGFPEDTSLSFACMNKGASDYFQLPLDINELIRSITRLVADNKA